MKVYSRYTSITYAKDIKMIKRFIDDKSKLNFNMLSDISKLFEDHFKNFVLWYPNFDINITATCYSKPEILMFINNTNASHISEHLENIGSIFKKVPRIWIYANANTTSFRNNPYYILKDRRSKVRYSLNKKIQKDIVIKSKSLFHRLHI